MRTTYQFIGLAIAALSIAPGCRLERDVPESPFAPDAGALQGEGDGDEPSEPAGGGASGSLAAGEGGTAGTPIEDGGGDAGEGGNPSAGAGGASGAAGGPLDPDGAVIGGGCEPDVLACNPVTNEGCPPPMQCAVDLVSDTLAGYCIFNGPVADGCFNSGVTESCPPTETCFEFECRTLCFCDDDCKEGQCCVDPIGTLGFKACGDC